MQLRLNSEFPASHSENPTQDTSYPPTSASENSPESFLGVHSKGPFLGFLWDFQSLLVFLFILLRLCFVF